MKRLALTLVIWLFCVVSYAQCSLLSTSISVDFSANGVCAPVTVNTFDVTYTFNAAQTPADISIEFIWNDPLNMTETIVFGGGLIVSNADRTYQAIATPFPYPNTGPECFFEAQAFVLVGGVQCVNSEQTQIVPSWNVDDQNGGIIALTPGTYEVCENNAIVNAVFTDASTFNCNIAANPDNPNQISRWTQFVYGTDLAPAVGRIRDVTIDDGGPQAVTNGTGNFSAASTRGTAGLMVTGGYFGAPVEVPFMADVPNNISFPISAPANLLNVAGSTFEITLFNWNTCNPYNGDAANPNYVDAVLTTLELTIIPPPVPNYEARDGNAAGAPLAEFCINEDIYFANLTGGPFTYLWEFFDGPLDTDLSLGTSTAVNPTFQFNTGGDKLVRLIATDGAADGACDVIFDNTVTLTPDVVAVVTIYDDLFVAPINALYCQTGTGAGKIDFPVGIADESTGVNPTTQYRYEIRDEFGGFVEDIPAGPGYSLTPIADFSRTYTDEGLYVITLFARNVGSLCSSFDSDTVFIYDQPEPIFTADEACDGGLTTFSGIVDEIAGIPIRVNNDIINLYEWDFSYSVVDGFNIELSRADNNDFTQALGAAGPYEVAVRAMTEKGGCVSEIVTQTVTVNPNPDSQFTHNVIGDLCPGDIVTFTNTSSNPALPLVDYFLEVSHGGSGFFSSTMFAGPTIDLPFDNPDAATRTYDAVVRARTSDNCETLSGVLMFNVSPDETSGFDDSNYDLFNTNCAPWNSTLVVDPGTQALAPDAYQWTISDNNGVVTGFPVSKVNTDPNFHELDYNLTNTSNAIVTFEVVLEVTKTGVCVANDTFNLQISPQPAALFTIMRDEDCDEVVLELEATQKGLTDYTWTYNPAPDNEFGSDDQRLISYTRDANAGTDIIATINLVTTNLAGCPSEMVTLMETVEKRKPDIVASFTIPSDTVQLPDATVPVTNTSTADAGYTYLWEYGDAQTATSRDPEAYTYTQFGSFQIRLTITDEFCEVETFQTVVVLPADPVIDFEADTLLGCTPLTIQFTNLSQSARSGEFLWEFGDGSISQLDNPIHTYFDRGNFDVRLRGTNDVGVTMETQKTEYIQSFGRPFADFLVSARVVFIPDDEVHFRNLSENAVEYLWDFGDGETSTESDPSHAYLMEGKYDIKLIATNELGCADTLFRAAEIEAIVGGETSSPNAFTPNNSGPNGGIDNGGVNVNSVNDIFLPKLEGVIRFKMFVYNKWGQLLFKSENQRVGWDGYFNGKLAPAGVYIYKLEVRYSDNRDEIIAGDVTLIR